MESLTLSHRLPPSCSRGPQELRPGLHLSHSPNAGCVLMLTFASGATCEVYLAPRYKRFVLAVLRGWQEDKGQIEGLRGFRSKEVIAARTNELSPDDSEIDAKTVPVYVYEIHCRIREAAGKLDPAERGDQPIPRLFENDHDLGYRIAACGLDVVLFRPITTITD